MKETTLKTMGFFTCKELRERACDIMISFNEREHTFLIKCALGLG